MIRIYPAQFSGRLTAPPSKAHAQRLLFMASMPALPTIIKNMPECDDIDTTISVLETLGCSFEKTKRPGELVVKPFPKTTPVLELGFNFRESGTTARLTMALCASLGIKASCKAYGTLNKRKMLALSSRMAIRGVTFTGFSLPFTMSGRLEGGSYECSGDEGSQAISSLMMFLPTLLNDSTIKIDSPLVDRSFIDITREYLEKFDIKMTETEEGFYIPGRQYFQSPKSVTAENDWSLASMWIMASAACGIKEKGITVDGLPKNSHQMYRNLSPLLALISQDFMDINIDASEFPNLTTLLCALAIAKGATIRISGVPQLKYKETNRLNTMAHIAKALGQDAAVSDDGITVFGNGNAEYREDTVVDCEGDPWVFMSMALSAATLKRPILLTDEHGADKTYRSFLRDYKNLGGKYDIV